MHFVKQRRQPLNFINHDPIAGPSGSDLTPKYTWIGKVRLESRFAQQINPHGLREPFPGPRAFTNSA